MKVSRQHDATGAKFGNPKIKVATGKLWMGEVLGRFFSDLLIGVFFTL